MRRLIARLEWVDLWLVVILSTIALTVLGVRPFGQDPMIYYLVALLFVAYPNRKRRPPRGPSLIYEDWRK